MKTIKIIDLYNKIANKEEIPKKIKFENCVYIYNEFDEFYYINGNDECSTLFDRVSYFDMTSLIDFLNEEVEIIEDAPKDASITLRGTPNSIRKTLDLPPECDLPQYKDWWEQQQEIKASKEVAADYLKENIKLKEIKKIENLKYRSHCGGTFQEEQKYRNERDEEIVDKINEIIKRMNRRGE